MGWSHLAVVMPAYNEHVGISDFVNEVADHLTPCCDQLTVVLVDDASSVPLRSVIAIKRRAPALEVTVLRNRQNLGHGPSVLRGYRAALARNPDAIIHVDGDGQFQGKDFPGLLRELERNDVVHGQRSNRNDPWFRRVISMSLRRWVANPDLRDVNTPLRAYRPPTLETLLQHVPEKSLVPHIWFAICLKQLGHSVVEVPVQHLQRRHGSTQGTTWGRREHNLVPPRRLVSFCILAAWEIVGKRRSTQRPRPQLSIATEG